MHDPLLGEDGVVPVPVDLAANAMAGLVSAISQARRPLAVEAGCRPDPGRDDPVRVDGRNDVVSVALEHDEWHIDGESGGPAVLHRGESRGEVVCCTRCKTAMNTSGGV